MRKLTVLSLSALVLTAAGYAASRFLGARGSQWQTVGTAPSPAAGGPMAADPSDDSRHASLAPEPIDMAEPADLYDVEQGTGPEAVNAADEGEVDDGWRPGTSAKPFDPLTDPLPDDQLE